jgi:hypothetical protein
MATTTYSLNHPGSSFVRAIRWDRALQAGLIVGAIMFLLPRGIPWLGSGAIDPARMGREVAPGKEATPMFFFGVMSIHFLVAAAYGLIIAPIVHGFRPFLAGAVGAVVGLVLYFISYAVSGMVMETGANLREWPSIVMHVIFGIVCAETYKGMVRRRRDVPLM